jgi:hypothetical protein
MTKTNDEIYNNDLLNPEKYEEELALFDSRERKSNYSQWVEAKGSQVIEEKELKPLLNIRIKKVNLDIDNPIFYLVGKLRIGSYTILPGENDKYTSFTEVGLLELGGERKIALIPGEMEPAVLSGSDAVKGDYSFSGEDFSSTPLCQSAEDEKLTVFGLSNDAIGYIIPDNDFILNETVPYIDPATDIHGRRHYEETNSTGPETARTILNAIESLIKSVK